MAMIVRDQNRLLALQLEHLTVPGGATASRSMSSRSDSIERAPAREVVSCALFNGPAPIGGTLELPACEFGLPEGSDEKAFASAKLRLPEALIAPLRAAAERLLPGPAPLWLYIPREAAKLALFPWEAEIARTLGRPLLRLPNFLDDPFEAGGTFEIALAVSLPEECGAGRAQDLVSTFFRSLDDERPHPDILVHVFADAACEDLVARLVPPASSGLRVELHPAQTAGEATRALESSRAPRSGLISPWLNWMGLRLKGKPVDLVHFLCPSYYTDTCGYLALHQTREAQSYPLWRRLIAIEEVCVLLDQLGTKGVSFAAAGPGQCERAVRRIAFDVSWRRPGPVIALPEDPDGAGLATALQVICGANAGDIGRLGGTIFTCHPRHLLAGSAAEAAPNIAAEAHLPPPDIGRTLRSVAKGRDAEPKIGSISEESFPERAVGYRSLRSEAARVTSNAERLVDRYLRKSQAALSTAQETSRVRRLEQEGAAKALDLVDSLLAKAAQTGGPDKTGN